MDLPLVLVLVLILALFLALVFGLHVCDSLAAFLSLFLLTDTTHLRPQGPNTNALPVPCIHRFLFLVFFDAVFGVFFGVVFFGLEDVW